MLHPTQLTQYSVVQWRSVTWGWQSRVTLLFLAPDLLQAVLEGNAEPTNSVSVVRKAANISGVCAVCAQAPGIPSVCVCISMLCVGLTRLGTPQAFTLCPFVSFTTAATENAAGVLMRD